MISINCGFSKGLVFILFVAQSYDPIVSAFAPKQCNIPSSQHHGTVVFMNGQLRSNDDWEREMRMLQRAKRAEDEQQRKMQMEQEKFYEEQRRMARIAEMVAEKKALDQAMVREKMEAREAERYAKNYAAARVIEEKRRQAEQRKWEQAEAKRALEQARAEAIVKLKTKKSYEVNDRDREAARAKAFMQAKAAAVDGGSMQGNFDPYDMPSQRPRAFGKTQYPSPNQVQYTPSRDNDKNSYRNNENQSPPTFFYHGNTNQNLYQNNRNQAVSTANNQNPYQNNRRQNDSTTYSQNLYQNNQNGTVDRAYNQNPYQSNQNQPALTQYSKTPYQNNQNQAAGRAYNQNPYQNKQNRQNFSNGNLPPLKELNSLLDTAITAAIEAGQIVTSNMGGTDVSKWRADPRDLLTEIDLKCQRVIKDRILNRFPNHDFLGDSNKNSNESAFEEKLRNGRSDYLWIVDAIDGKIMIIFHLNVTV